MFTYLFCKLQIWYMCVLLWQGILNYFWQKNYIYFPYWSYLLFPEGVSTNVDSLHNVYYDLDHIIVMDHSLQYLNHFINWLSKDLKSLYSLMQLKINSINRFIKQIEYFLSILTATFYFIKMIRKLKLWI